MRRALVIAAVLLQVLALAGMAGKRELIRAYGQTIYLRSAPIDPRDPFRGDYVQLNYALSSVKERDMRGTLALHKNEKGTEVYAVLKPNGDVYTLDTLTDQKPEEGLFIKGYTAYRWDYQPTANIKYGIEKYFVQQGKGLEMEKQLGARNTLQIPLEMQIAVGDDGTAVIIDHRWSRLGIQLEVLRSNNRQPNGQAEADVPLSPKVKVTLKNVSDQPLTLANPGDNCAFELEWVTNNTGDYRIAENDCVWAKLTEKSLIRLKPDETYTADIDLSQPRWYIRHDNKLEEIGAIDGWQQFRLVYRSPGKEEVTQFADVAPFWLGELPTAAFNGRGRVD